MRVDDEDLAAVRIALGLPASAPLRTRELSSGAYHEHAVLRLDPSILAANASCGSPPSADWHPSAISAGSRLSAAGRSWVLRRCIDSQWGLSPQRQLAREQATLRVLAPTGVAPAPHALVCAPGGPILVEELVEGERFSYDRDLPALGSTLARVHALTASHLPSVDAAAELLADGRAWLDRAIAAGDDADAAALVGELRGRARSPAGALHMLVHTDLNAGNLVVTGGRCRLLDWEAARMGDPAWDLAHAVSPTTTQWDASAACVATPRQVRCMLAAYVGEAVDPAAAAATVERLPALLDAVMYRALAWVLGFAAQARSERIVLGAGLAAAVARYRDPAFVERCLGARALLGLG